MVIYMINLEQSQAIFQKIYPDKYLCELLSEYIGRHKLKIKMCLAFCRSGRWELFLKKDPFFKLCLVFAYLPEVWRQYEAKGIGEDIFFDTMDDIRIWIDDHHSRTGEYGLFELNWIMHHMKLNIFKLGRLQFQKFKYYFSPVYKKNGVTIRFGENVLNIHIPRGEKLDISSCRQSIRRAGEFFSKYYPEYPTDRFICHSWMLYTGNKKYMKSESNILKFADMFDIVGEREAPSQAYLWIFGVKVKNTALMLSKENNGNYGFTKELTQETSLQKSAVDYIEDGGTLGEGMGVLTVKAKIIP